MKRSLNNNFLQSFNYKLSTVRTTVINGEKWFLAKDVCTALGLVNISKTVQNGVNSCPRTSFLRQYEPYFFTVKEGEGNVKKVFG